MLDRITDPPRDHEGKIIGFPSTPWLVDYIRRVVKNHDLEKFATFSCVVEKISPLSEESNDFLNSPGLLTKNRKNRKKIENFFEKTKNERKKCEKKKRKWKNGNIEKTKIEKMIFCFSGVLLEVLHKSSGERSRHVFGSVVCATGRFLPSLSIIPQWAQLQQNSPMSIVQVRLSNKTRITTRKTRSEKRAKK